MRKETPVTRGATLLIAAALLFGQGCSNNSSVGPANAHLLQSVAIVNTEPTFVETFDNHSNVGKWSFLDYMPMGIETIEDDGGNPGAFLHARIGPKGYLSTFAPMLSTRVGGQCIFLGDYREKNVIQVGVDLAIFGPSYIATGDRPLSLMLRNNNGTPGDYGDDLTVYLIGHQNIPDPDSVWETYTLTIPAQSTTIPDGWGVMNYSGTMNDDEVWNEVITDVSELTFFYGNPEMFFILQPWELGVDNVRIWFDQ